MKHFSILLIGLVLISGFGATQGCTETFEKVFSRQNKPKETPKVENKVFNEELEKNRILWREQNIANYKIKADFIFHGERYSAPIFLEIGESKNTLIEPVTKEDLSNPEYQRNIQFYERFSTVESMFERIQEIYDKKEGECGDRVSVKYNKKLGYPESISVSDVCSVHFSYFIKIKKFEIIKDLSRS